MEEQAIAHDLLGICGLLEQLRCYASPLRLLLQFVPRAAWPAVGGGECVPSALDVAERLRTATPEQIRDAVLLGSALLPSEEAPSCEALSPAFSASAADASFGALLPFPPAAQQQQPLDGDAAAVGGAFSAAETDAEAAEVSRRRAEFCVATMPGMPWEPVRTVVQLYFLKELLANFAAVQLLFRVLADVDADAALQRQTLSALAGLLRTLQPADLAATRAEIAALGADGGDYGSRVIAIVERRMQLRRECFNLYAPLLALLSLSPEEAALVADALPKMVPTQFFQIARLRVLSPTDILELQSLLWPVKREPLVSEPMIDQACVPQQQQQQQQQQETVPPASVTPTTEAMTALTAPGPLQLTIIEQPPERCVYKRNVKPAPTVVISGGETPAALSGLAVAAMLYRCDQNSDETRSLSGNAPVDVTPSRVVVFRKLKVLVTSHQLSETLFVFRFELRRYCAGPGSDYEIIHAVTSTPMNVVSHSTQLRTAAAAAAVAASAAAAQIQAMQQQHLMHLPLQQQPQPQQQQQQQPLVSTAAPAMCKPTVLEVVPCVGRCAGGTRVAVLGGNFADSPSTRVRFGDGPEVVPVFHGPGTLICNTPPHLNCPGVVSVHVCNAPGVWSDSAASFTYDARPSAMPSTSAATTTTTTAAPATSPPTISPAEAICEPVVCGDVEELRSRIRTMRGGGRLLDELDPRGFSALHYAAVLSASAQAATAEAIIDALVSAGASVNVRDSNGNTPLHWAAATGNEAAIARLVTHGASPQSQNDDGDTPLHTAAATSWTGAAACCVALIAAGAPVNAQEGPHGETPLHRAAAVNNQATVNALLEHGASARIVDEDGDTPLHTAAASGAINVVRSLAAALARSGADANVRNADSETPLQIAATLGDAALVDLLVSVGAERGHTPVISQPQQALQGRRRSRSVVEASAMRSAVSAYARRRRRRSGTLSACDEASKHHQQQQQQQLLVGSGSNAMGRILSVSQPALPSEGTAW